VAGDAKGDAVNALSIGGIICLLTVVAYSGITAALSGAGGAQPSATVSQTPALLPGRFATEVTDNGNLAATDFAVYVRLHETRDSIDSFEGASGVNICAR
jgi:hypothetical protein